MEISNEFIIDLKEFISGSHHPEIRNQKYQTIRVDRISGNLTVHGAASPSPRLLTRITIRSLPSRNSQ